MTIKRPEGVFQAAIVFAGVLAAIAAFWYVTFLICKLTGFELQTTPQYGFTSGIGPMILAAIGMTTIITGLWHHANCHVDGCLRVGSHPAGDFKVCRKHHHEIRRTSEVTVASLRRHVNRHEA
jgi:hypothetical protein